MLTHMKTDYAESLEWKASVEGTTTLKPNDQDAVDLHPWRRPRDVQVVPLVSPTLLKPDEGLAGPGKERSPAQPGQIVTIKGDTLIESVGLNPHWPIEATAFKLMRGNTTASRTSEPGALQPVGRTVTSQATEDLIARLRDDNRIPIADIARACDVSRQTIYGWLSGQQASDSHLKRLRDLARMAEQLIAAGNHDSVSDVPIAKALRRPITDGLSLLDAIARDDDPGAFLEHLVAILSREAAEHQRLVERLGRGRRRVTGRLPDDPIGDIGAPAYDETDAP